MPAHSRIAVHEAGVSEFLATVVHALSTCFRQSKNLLIYSGKKNRNKNLAATWNQLLNLKNGRANFGINRKSPRWYEFLYVMFTISCRNYGNFLKKDKYFHISWWQFVNNPQTLEDRSDDEITHETTAPFWEQWLPIGVTYTPHNGA